MARRPAVFSADTKLWHSQEGWKLFPQGEQDPGPAWHTQEGGEPPGAATTGQAMKDLIAAQDQLEAMQGRLAARDHDLAQAAKRAADAEAKTADLEQALRDAQLARREAESIAAQLTRERDQARAQIKPAKAA